MKVKLHNRYAGPMGNFPPGTEIEVSPEEGRALCEGNFATPVKCVGPKEVATVEPPETAADVGDAKLSASRPRSRPVKTR